MEGGSAIIHEPVIHVRIGGILHLNDVFAGRSLALDVHHGALVLLAVNGNLVREVLDIQDFHVQDITEQFHKILLLEEKILESPIDPQVEEHANLSWRIVAVIVHSSNLFAN